jgi:hypothetical protein
MRDGTSEPLLVIYPHWPSRLLLAVSSSIYLRRFDGSDLEFRSQGSAS